jgi:hypothetical protein
MMSGLSACIAGAISLSVDGAGVQARSNWFNDPFFAITHDVAACPEPLGPLVTEQEALQQTHHRLERGLRCHLEGRCSHPSSFDYDREIATRIQARAALIAPRRSSLWILVQGRRVWVYGCVASTYRRGTLEKALRAIPDVELALEEVRIGKRGAAPYAVK